VSRQKSLPQIRCDNLQCPRWTPKTDKNLENATALESGAGKTAQSDSNLSSIAAAWPHLPRLFKPPSWRLSKRPTPRANKYRVLPDRAGIQFPPHAGETPTANRGNIRSFSDRSRKCAGLTTFRESNDELAHIVDRLIVVPSDEDRILASVQHRLCLTTAAGDVAPLARQCLTTIGK
jgi:hypothetical protein